MREIKFRIWDINARKWLKSFNTNLLDIHEFNLAKIMQYTGLKDKNNKEIYEGDIVKFLNGIFEVIWCNEKASFMLKNKEYKEFLNFIYENNNVMEIVGNIYKNPELIKE